MHPSLPVFLRPDVPMLLGATLHLAKGFSRDPKPPRSSKKVEKSLRGKLIPCTTCTGTGKKACQFCEGTKLMKGFLNRRVPCVPCKATGTLGRPCPECSGMGYFTS